MHRKEFIITKMQHLNLKHITEGVCLARKLETRFSSLRDDGPVSCCSSLQPCYPEATQRPHTTVGTMPWAPTGSAITGSHLLSKWPILETIFWVCLFICFFCPTCWEWWQGSFLVNIVNSALKVTFPTEKQLFRVCIFKQISQKKVGVFPESSYFWI